MRTRTSTHHSLSIHPTCTHGWETSPNLRSKTPPNMRLRPYPQTHTHPPSPQHLLRLWYNQTADKRFAMEARLAVDTAILRRQTKNPSATIDVRYDPPFCSLVAFLRKHYCTPRHSDENLKTTIPKMLKNIPKNTPSRTSQNMYSPITPTTTSQNRINNLSRHHCCPYDSVVVAVKLL